MNVLIIGATSAIATATARYYAEKHKASLFLVARNEQAMETLSADLTVRGSKAVTCKTVDFAQQGNHRVWIDDAFEALGQIDLVLIAHGVLPDQQKCQEDLDALRFVFEVNAMSSIEVLTLLANKLENQGNGTIAYISSVAGDRGRPSNYVYGASKAVITTFLGGLRARLAKAGVHVLTIKPGFVDTPMTAEFDKSGPLWAQPEDIASGIAKAVEKKKNTVYLPWFWRIIMGIIIHIPEFIFKKLNL